MGAKVKQVKGTWTVVVHHNRRRQMRAIGPTEEDKRRAERMAEKVNAAITLGQFGLDEASDHALPCGQELDVWLQTYLPTLKPATRKLYRGLVDNHLKPHFGDRDIREIR